MYKLILFTILIFFLILVHVNIHFERNVDIMSHRQLKSIQNVFLTVLHELQIEHNVYSNWYSVDY